MTTSQPKLSDFAPFPWPDAAYDYAGERLAQHWERLHQGDAEPWPEDEQVQEAWRAYHAGDFARAVSLGLGAGEDGLNVANKALVIHASYLLDDKYAKRAAFELAASNREAAKTPAGQRQRLVLSRPGAGSLQPGDLGLQGALHRHR